MESGFNIVSIWYLDASQWTLIFYSEQARPSRWGSLWFTICLGTHLKVIEVAIANHSMAGTQMDCVASHFTEQWQESALVAKRNGKSGGSRTLTHIKLSLLDRHSSESVPPLKPHFLSSAHNEWPLRTLVDFHYLVLTPFPCFHFLGCHKHLFGKSQTLCF